MSQSTLKIKTLGLKTFAARWTTWSLSYVDENKIGALGVCAGGGYTMSAVQTESRIQAAAAVSCADFDKLVREGLGSMQSSKSYKACCVKSGNKERARQEAKI